MPPRPRRSLRYRIRAYLGTDLLTSLENRMTTMLTLLQGLTDQTTAASAAQQSSFQNLHNALARLTQNVKDLQDQVANGDVSPEVQALATQLAENLATMAKAADTADDGFEPVEPPVDDGSTVPPTDQ